MSEEKDRGGAAVRVPPPLVPVIALVLGFAAAWLFGDLPNPIAGSERFAIGGFFVVAGFWLMAMAIGLFRKSGQDPAPWASSPELIAEGIYRWTRNPMYLGMGLLQVGLGALFSNMWIVALVPLTWIVIYFIAIRHEEAYLESTFGAPYLEYKKTVRRWL
jgi:protein-S-isoprenylcysteine O-methyltransferase Ste14